jgi:hypothetical protein
MRKHAGFAMAAVLMALGAILLVRSSVLATQADIARPKVRQPPYVVMSNPYLPIHAMEEVY